MDASKNPNYLHRTAEAVAEFRQALVAFLELHTENTMARGLMPAILTREGVTPDEVARRQAEVGRAAGRASSAPGLTGCYFEVAGIGRVDPIAAWQSMTQPKPVMDPESVLGACDQMLGRLEALEDLARAEAPPEIGAAAMHPLVWGAARRLWSGGHFRHAVASAADALVAQVKTLTNRNDVSESSLWQQTFSNKDPEPGKPRLRWPGNLEDRDVSTMNEGLRLFAPGAQLTIRNPAAHGTELSEQEALERLATLSLLARWVDECQLVEPTEASTSA